MFIGVIYCSTNINTPLKDKEELADREVVDTAFAVKSALEKKGHRVDLVNFEENKAKELSKYEWIFNLVDTIRDFPLAEYKVAVIMERLGIPFTGSGSKPLLTCMYKSSAKTQIQQHGIRTPRFEIVSPGDNVKTSLAFPLIVKPDHEDGSIGIKNDSVVQSMPELTKKIFEIHRVYGQAALIEEFIDGREITASIIGNGDDLTVFPLSEIVFSDDYIGPRILTFEEKWVEESQAYQKSAVRCPCLLDEQTQAEIKNIAIEVVNILGCSDYVRVDFRLRGNQPYVLEVNPNPCINPSDSGYILAGAANGLNYDEIINNILNHSILRMNKFFGNLRGNPQISCGKLQ